MGIAHKAVLEAMSERKTRPVFTCIPSMDAVFGIIVGIEFVMGCTVKSRVVEREYGTFDLYVDICDELTPTSVLDWRHYSIAAKLHSDIENIP